MTATGAIVKNYEYVSQGEYVSEAKTVDKEMTYNCLNWSTGHAHEYEYCK